MSLLAAGCADLPSLADRGRSTALRDTDATTLGKSAGPQAGAHPGLSGIHMLEDPDGAFAARMLLARAAERSLDVQYYIWRDDLTGTMLFDALRDAAGRGVRVRLLLDDNNTGGLDALLAALDSHPNIEVRLFNPFRFRGVRALGYLTDFARLNRRMHNKSFTADNQATIVGGRNVGDEYFGAGNGVLFSDLDVLAIGPVVDAVSSDFDRYWASPAAYPAARLLRAADPAALADLAQAAARAAQKPEATTYIEAVRKSPFVSDLIHRQLELDWVPVQLLSDDPEKVLGRAPGKQAVLPKLKQSIGDAQRRLSIVSPYFVPADGGTRALTALAAQGVKIEVLTNALEATDVAAVHAGYAKRRKALLEAGITLFELRREAGGEPKKGGSGFAGSSAASLHAKTFAADGLHVFVGSFNFDPRSARLNTEMGFLIDSAAIAAQIAEAFNSVIPARSYRVRLSDAGELEWVERRGGQEVVLHTEPGTSVWQRAWIRFLSILPIEWML